MYRGVRAPDAFAEKQREVFNHTLGFDLRFNSLADARDAVTATDDYTQELEHVLELFNGNWDIDRPEHYCCHEHHATQVLERLGST